MEGGGEGHNGQCNFGLLSQKVKVLLFVNLSVTKEGIFSTSANTLLSSSDLVYRDREMKKGEGWANG